MIQENPETSCNIGHVLEVTTFPGSEKSMKEEHPPLGSCVITPFGFTRAIVADNVFFVMGMIIMLHSKRLLYMSRASSTQCFMLPVMRSDKN